MTTPNLHLGFHILITTDRRKEPYTNTLTA